MTLSVFGSTGFIGSKFCEMYEDAIGIDRNNNVPLPDKDVLYLISTTHNYHVYTDAFLDIQTNLVKLVHCLEEFSKHTDDNVFNFISSWFVYGDTDIPANEQSRCSPKGFYSITKYAAEQLVESYCKTFNLNFRIMRLCNVYGESAMGVSKKRNALQFMIRKIIDGEVVELYDNGEDIRDFMHVEDVCRAIKLCMEKAPLNETINIGSGIPQTFRPLMEYVKTKVESSSDLLDVDPPSFHKTVQVKDMYLNVDKLVQLGFKQRIDIFDGINRILEKEKNV